MLPADNHVHSQWSWDTLTGDMEATCAEAVRLGLPSVAFTEHVDHTVWDVRGATVPESWLAGGTVVDGRLTPRAFDVDGYLESVERCRHAFPSLRILTGVELGEPHWHATEVSELLATGLFERRLASLHSAPIDGEYVDTGQHYRFAPPEQVVADYLDEIARLVTAYDDFQVLAHIDYVLRRWPEERELDLGLFEDRYRHALDLLAAKGKALEINTRVPLPEVVLRWWHQAGGEAVSFASDAHRPDWVGRRFAEARDLAEACGFRPARDPLDFWRRTT